jgi:hypothetical protein
MTSSNGVVIKRSPRQHGFITTMACGLRRVRGRKNREILLSSANGMRNIEQSMVIMRCRSVFSFNQVAINCLEMPRPGTQIYCTRIPAFQDYLIHQAKELLLVGWRKITACHFLSFPASLKLPRVLALDQEQAIARFCAIACSWLVATA